MKDLIRAKAVLGLPLTEKEKALFILFLASDEEVHQFLARQK